MVIILPNKVDGLTKVEGQLSGKVLDKMEENAKQKKLCVKLSKFKIKTNVVKELMEALFTMGFKDLSVSGLADLSGLSSDSPGLFAPAIGQNCWIMVDEEGTEATAATAPARNNFCYFLYFSQLKQIV